MKIRNLELKDAQEMYTWVKNSDIRNLLTGSYPCSLEEILIYIDKSQEVKDEKRFAITNDEDIYEGTVSLRYIDYNENLAELSIVVKERAMSKGYAWYGMVETLKYAFEKLGIEKVYWYVDNENKRAIRFFKKHGFNTLDEDVPKDIIKRHAVERDVLWFVVLKDDDFENKALSRETIADCNIIKIRTVPTIEAGELSFFESMKEIPFEIKRIYYISKVPEGARRGFHAHKNLKQMLFCPFGRIQLILDNGKSREEITLNDPSVGIIIDRTIWREMLWLEKDSVLVVAASDYYNEDDYIRDYNDFLSIINEREDL